ncbi:MAG: HAMP domain-containing histidine kinase [Sphingobacteriia bacterium]|nr:HAMP domain-containing histidine kinase [Sphingobacteriia bacterium]
MKKKKISIVILLTSFALIGVIVTQLLWVSNAIRLRHELLDQNIQVGMKRVVNQIMILQGTQLTSRDCPKKMESLSYHKQFMQSLDAALVDSMIMVEFSNTIPGKDLYYGIYEIATNELLLCNCRDSEFEILTSPHKSPVSCVYQEDQFMLAVYYPSQQRFILHQMQGNLIMSALFTLVIILGFWYIISLLLQQKKISEMKNDFVNNMTHELKTPIATITIASEMLMNENIRNTTDKCLQYARIIHDENNRLRDQVDHVLQVARLERSDFNLKPKEINAHEIIQEVVNKFELPVKNRGGELITRLNAANVIIWADRHHITNTLQNLLDNAIKYSQGNPQVIVSTRSNNIGVTILVEDKGIGIEPQHLDKIFLQFHRIPTGNLHDVKGFGIGLYYVKKIVEAHRGTIQVSSTPGKGSTFTIFLPFKENLIKNDKPDY